MNRNIMSTVSRLRNQLAQVTRRPHLAVGTSSLVRGDHARSCVTPAAAAATACAVVFLTRSTSTAATARSDSDSDSDDLMPPPNPMWPSGVPSDMVDAFVDDILSDSGVNMSAIPDAVERQIYVSTVRLTLNAVYRSVGRLHGLEMLGHRLELRRIIHGGGGKGRRPNDVEMRAESLRKGPGLGQGRPSESIYISDAALEAVAERLLANAVINQPLVPDAVERQLYVNCLKLVFRLLDAVAATLRITLCGHDLKLQFEPCTADGLSSVAAPGDRAVERAASSLTEVNLDAVEAFAREAGVARPEDEEGRTWIGNLLEPSRREFVAQLHATLYALVLAIVDDLLEDTVLTFLSDQIRVDVVPMKGKDEATTVGTAGTATNNMTRVLQSEMVDVAQSEAVRPEKRNSSTTAPLAFTAGIGVGALLMLVACGGRSV